MKLAVVVGFLIGFLCVSRPSQVEAQELFPDKALEKVVRSYVFDKRYNEEPITEEDVKFLSVIKGVGKGIKSLQGLEKCRALAELDLRKNEISDLSALSELKLLQSLSLSQNQIEDIVPLKGLTRMQYLELTGNKVKDIAPLTELKAMRSLYLSGNEISSIEPVKGMDKIWSLYIDGNKVKDLTPIQDPKFLSSLDLKGNGLEGLESIAKFDDLSWLFLQDNQLTDLAVLVEMAKKDFEGQRRFAPFWKIYLKGNPLGAAAQEQIKQLQSMGARINLTD